MFSTKMLRVGVCLFAVSAAGMFAQQQSHLDGEDVSAWQGMVQINREMKRSGEGSYELYGKYPTEMISKDMIPIDPGRTYTLSCWMRSLSEKLPASGYMGLRMYDKDKRAIHICHVAAKPDTETTLMKAAAKGEKELLLAGNPNWPEKVQGQLAFLCKENYQDLPNFNLSAIQDVQKDENALRVQLKAALTRDYPENTCVRLHGPYGAPFYWGAQGWMPTEWKHFTWKLAGEAKSGSSSVQFWPGTKYVRFFIWFGNWDRKPQEGARLLVDDITFTSVPTEELKILGNVQMPQQWNVFGPLTEKELVDLNSIRTIPDSITVDGHTLPAHKVSATENQLDPRKIFSSFHFQDVAYFFGNLEVNQPGKVTFGLGADWWMQAWIDGKLLCDTTTTGNITWPPAIDDHCFEADLTAGTHLLVIRLISGKGGSKLKFAGPEQLRALKTQK